MILLSHNSKNYMSDTADYFKGKKITLMGLGLLGRGVGDAAFLAQLGADLIVTDMKSADELAPSFEKLKQYKNIRYTLGQHKLEDFRDRDLIIKGPKVPLDSPFIAEARRQKIPVTMSTALFAKLAGVPIIGVTGTRGKTTVASMIHTILKAAGHDAMLAGNIAGVSTLALLPIVTSDSVAVLELDSWQLQGFAEEKISPNIAVFSTFYDDHLDYYSDRDSYLADKASIFLYQEDGDTLVVGSQAADLIKDKYGKKICSHVVIPKELPKRWKLKIPGEHNRYNAALAAAVARAFGVDDEIIKDALEKFAGVPGRLELIAEKNSVKIYNDNNSTTPEATIAALRAIGTAGERRVVLIMGGDDKGLDMSGLIAEIPQWCSKVVLFKERGTDRIRDEVFALRSNGIDIFEEDGMEATVRKTFAVAKPGEIILYSPAFSSFGKYFKNEYDRGEQFVSEVKKHG